MPIIPPAARAQQAELIELWIQDLRENDKADTTIDSYSEVVCKAHAELPCGVTFATADELRAWIWAPGREPATRAKYRAAFVSFFGFATHPSNPRLDFDPTALLPKVRVPDGDPRPIEGDVLVDILNRARNPFRFWFLLAAGAGMRCIEISRCDREHITAEHIWLQGKGSKQTLIPTHPEIWAAAQDLPRGPVALMPMAGGRADRQNISNRAGKYLTHLGYPDVAMHRLRHYYGTAVRRASGGDLLLTQKAMRHSNIQRTAGYTAYTAPELLTAVHAVPLALAVA